MKAFQWLGLIPLLAGVVAPSSAAEAARVDVILWFDTEDYLSPADDDACKRLATMLTERHIRATFKVVGEKARVLERRGRRDVIDALKLHDIGFHANFHSVHPTPTEYLAECGLLDGMAEFKRREGGGAADVRRITARFLDGGMRSLKIENCKLRIANWAGDCSSRPFGHCCYGIA